MSQPIINERLICGTCGERGNLKTCESVFSVACHPFDKVCCEIGGYPSEELAIRAWERLTRPEPESDEPADPPGWEGGFAVNH